MDLENRVQAVVKKYLPEMPETDMVEVSAFLTAECFNLINEWVYQHQRQLWKAKRKDFES